MTPWTIACQTLLSMEFSRQEYWSGLPFPSQGDLPDPGMEPRSSALQADIPSYDLTQRDFWISGTLRPFFLSLLRSFTFKDLCHIMSTHSSLLAFFFLVVCKFPPWGVQLCWNFLLSACLWQLLHQTTLHLAGRALCLSLLRVPFSLKMLIEELRKRT